MRPEVLDRRTRVLDPLDNHPLEPLAPDRVDPGRLGFRLAELDRESLRAPANLRLTLPQLPRVPHEVNALRGDPDLLEPGCLGAVPLRGQGPAMALEVGGERVRRSRTL